MKKIAIIGQGYVGLPLAIEFAYHFPVLGFDIDPERQSVKKVHKLLSNIVNIS